MARALAHAHSRNLVHSDVKPSNVLVGRLAGTSPGTPATAFLCDFGLSRVRGKNDATWSSLRAGRGTLGYVDSDFLSPPPGFALHQGCDVYAFCVLTAQALASPFVPLYAGIPPQGLAQAVVNGLRPPTHGLPPSLASALELGWRRPFDSSNTITMDGLTAVLTRELEALDAVEWGALLQGAGGAPDGASAALYWLSFSDGLHRAVTVLTLSARHDAPGSESARRCEVLRAALTVQGLVSCGDWLDPELWVGLSALEEWGPVVAAAWEAAWAGSESTPALLFAHAARVAVVHARALLLRNRPGDKDKARSIVQFALRQVDDAARVGIPGVTPSPEVAVLRAELGLGGKENVLSSTHI